MSVKETAKAVRSAYLKLSALSGEQRAAALLRMADALERERESVLAANREDMEAASEIAPAVRARLRFDEKKLAGCVEGLRALAALPDKVGAKLAETELAPGLVLEKVACPIGVIGIIFEARPDALVQIASLCLKSGNGALLKGGSEAQRTNRALYDVIYRASVEAGCPEGWLALLETRADVSEMLSEDETIDLLIPRGSNEFVRYIMDNSHIPVMGHADGICHLYLDAAADKARAVAVAVDSKCQYMAACNACETLLVHEAAAETVLPAVAAALREKGITLYGCERAQEILGCAPPPFGWAHEYLGPELSVRVVSDLERAVEHINTYGSGHTDAIVTEDRAAAERFLDAVDSADVFWNCSTRFADGFRFGFGAEVGISTSKIHARGPVGLEGLMIYKYKLRGSGDTVAPFAEGERNFTHKKRM